MTLLVLNKQILVLIFSSTSDIAPIKLFSPEKNVTGKSMWDGSIEGSQCVYENKNSAECGVSPACPFS